MAWLLPIMPVLGLIAMAMSLSHLLPIAISLALRDGMARRFLGLDGAQFRRRLRRCGSLTRRHRRELQLREGILFIALVWVGGALFACVPLLFGIGLSFTDAYFESMSALTATGATLLDGLDRPAAFAQRVARRAAVARRHGRHRAGGRGAADDRRRRAPDLQGRDSRADEGRPADAAHDADRERAVDRLLRADARVLRRLLALRACRGSTR